MPTLREIAEPIRAIFTTVLPIGDGICNVCHGAPSPGYSICYSCRETTAQVTRPLHLVVPISLSRMREQLHHVLWSYKNVTVLDLRRRFRAQVAATVGVFLSQHGDCIRGVAGREWDAITVVPSSGDRSGTHPLIETLRMIRHWDQELTETLRRGPVHIGHTIADDAGFEVTQSVAGQSLLLVDDTLTSGARLQSAASALSLAGADVVAAVVVGRVINPDFSDAARQLWDRSRQVPYSLDRCCLEDL
jgi:predicted amidophosphoribosyltransferase